MKQKLFLLVAATVFALVCTASASAGETPEKKTVIALKTDDFEMAETDISDLEVGESETIVTDSGKTIDLLRTEEGLEVYIDGELLEMDFDAASAHDEHGTMHKQVKIVCKDDEECDEDVFVLDAHDIDVEMFHGEEGEHRIIRKRIEIECDDEGECEDHHALIHGDGDFDMEKLHELGGEHGEKVIIIKKKAGEN